MTTCRDVRAYLRRTGSEIASLTNLPLEISRHLTSCTRCLAERRVVWILRQGSGSGTETPAPGFEERLRGRISDAPPRVAEGPGPSDAPWPDILAGLARPALSAASVAAAVALAAYVSARAGLFLGPDAGLSLLVRGDGQAETILEDWGVEP